MSSFHFYHGNQYKVIPLACTLPTRNLPKFSATSDACSQVTRHAMSITTLTVQVGVV